MYVLLELQLLSGVGCSYSDVSPYFVNAFGSYERLDYGTGHELNFIAFLLCLSKVGVLGRLSGMCLYVCERVHKSHTSEALTVCVCMCVGVPSKRTNEH